MNRIQEMLLLFGGGAWDGKYYVDATNGNDSNTGKSLASPFKTTTPVNALTLNPGEQVLFKCGETFKAQHLIVPSSGTVAKPITFGKYGVGANPIFDPTVAFTDWVLHTGAVYKRTDASQDVRQVFENGARMIYAASETGLPAGAYAYVSGVVYVRCTDSGNPNSKTIEYVQQTTNNHRVVAMNGKSNLVFDGIDVKKHSTAYVTNLDNSANITVQNLTVSFGRGRSIILGTDETNAKGGMSDLTIKNCVGHDDLDVSFWIGRGTRLSVLNCTTYNSGLDCSPRAKNYPITGGEIHYPTGIMVSGLNSVDCVVKGNHVYNCYGGPGICDETSPTTANHTTGTIIENNLVDMTNGSTTSYGIRIAGINTIVRNNIVYQFATTVEAISCFNTPTGPLIYHNTVIAPDGAAHSVIFTTGSGIKFKNNIIIRAGSTNRYLSMFAAAGTGAEIDYNEYYGGSFKALWGPAAEYTSFAAWKGDAHSPDAHSLNSDPVFVTANTDLHLQNTSPCKNAGADLRAVVPLDRDGITRDATPDIGAYEKV